MVITFLRFQISCGDGATIKMWQRKKVNGIPFKESHLFWVPVRLSATLMLGSGRGWCNYLSEWNILLDTSQHSACPRTPGTELSKTSLLITSFLWRDIFIIKYDVVWFFLQKISDGRRYLVYRFVMYDTRFFPLQHNGRMNRCNIFFLGLISRSTHHTAVSGVFSGHLLYFLPKLSRVQWFNTSKREPWIKLGSETNVANKMFSCILLDTFVTSRT